MATYFVIFSKANRFLSPIVFLSESILVIGYDHDDKTIHLNRLRPNRLLQSIETLILFFNIDSVVSIDNNNRFGHRNRFN